MQIIPRLRFPPGHRGDLSSPTTLPMPKNGAGVRIPPARFISHAYGKDNRPSCQVERELCTDFRNLGFNAGPRGWSVVALSFSGPDANGCIGPTIKISIYLDAHGHSDHSESTDTPKSCAYCRGEYPPLSRYSGQFRCDSLDRTAADTASLAEVTQVRRTDGASIEGEIR